MPNGPISQREFSLNLKRNNVQSPGRKPPIHRRIKSSAPYVAFRQFTKAVRRRAKLHRYLGTDYRCPICNVHLRAFKPIWKSYRRAVVQYGWVHPMSAMETFNAEAYSCPRCDASDRERLMALYIDEVFGARSGPRRYRMVEFAPAYALHKAIERHPNIAYRTADLVRKDVDEQVDLTDMRGYADDSVDVFICSHMLEHIPEDRKAMRELHRVLRPDGFGIVLVPLIPGVNETHEDPSYHTIELRWKYFGDGDHVRQYGKQDFLDRLAGAGFAVDPLGIDHFGAETFRRHGIAPDSVLYIVRKGARQGAQS